MARNSPGHNLPIMEQHYSAFLSELTGPKMATEYWHDPDYVLARAAAIGSAGAVGDLYGRHSRRVYSICLRMTRNAADAEDLTQEVFIHLMRKIGSFQGESRFTTWLHRVTVNLVLMRFRRCAIRRERQMSDHLETKI